MKNWLPFVGIAVVYIAGMFLDVMDVDAAQYASISKEMAMTGEFLQVKNRFEDYLDKPPLLFWLTAACFKVLGVSNFAYRLPAVLMSLLGFWALYRYTLLWYTPRAALLAVLTAASSQAFILMNHDVRTDTMLAATVMLANWQFALWLRCGCWRYLLLGAAATGLAMMAKGPIGLIAPGAAVFCELVLKRNWRQLLDWRWLVGLPVLALVLLPMCIGLYQQFDAHPEKGVSGLRFFFWTQSFGRITGENTWQNDVDITFQAQNFLWSWLPWALLFGPALYLAFRHLWQRRFRLSMEEDGMTLGGFVLPFLAVSTSQYQLPHYSYVVFPLAGVLTGWYIDKVLTEGGRWEKISQWMQYVVITILWILALLLVRVCFEGMNWLGWLVGLGALAATGYFLFVERSAYSRIVSASLTTILGVNFWLNVHVYPSLFGYQTASQVGRAISSGIYPADRTFVYRVHNHSLDFYSPDIVPEWRSEADIERHTAVLPVWVYTDSTGLQQLEHLGLRVKTVKDYDHFHVSTLTLPFLHPATRATQTDKHLVVQVIGRP